MKFLENRSRFLVLAITFAMTGSILNCVDCFTYAMVYMEQPSNDTTTNYTIRIYHQDEKNFLITTMAAGSLVGIIAFGFLYEHFGARYVLFGAGFCCSLISFTIPIALDTSLGCAIAARALQGFCFAADFSVIGLVASQWSPLAELGKFLAILSAFTGMKSIVQMPLAAWLVPIYGWRSLHYAMAAIMFFVSFIWLLVYRDDPRESSASPKEVARIHKGKSDAQNNMKIAVPYKKALTDVKLWLLWFAALIDVMASMFWMIYTVTYIRYLGFQEQYAALVSALAGYSFIFAKLAAGFASDHLRCLSELSKIHLFTVTSMVLTAFVYIAIPLTGGWVSVILIIIFQGLIGTNVGAFYKAALLMARQYSHFVVGQLQLFKSIALFVLPMMFSAFIPTKSHSEWLRFCIVLAISLIIGSVFLIFSAGTEPMDWVEGKTEKTTESEKSWKSESEPEQLETAKDLKGRMTTFV